MGELANVEKGVGYVLYGLCLIFAGILVMLLGAFMLAAASPAVVVAMITVGQMILTAGTILALVGRIMCLSVPDDCAATGVIYAAVGCDVTVVLISAASWFVDLPQLVSLLSNLLSLAATILFLIFLGKIAQHIRDNDSEQRAVMVLRLLIATFVTVFLGVCLTPLLIVALIMAIIGFFIYVRLLISLRQRLKAR
ncbi:MAG: hypothetical protein ABGZ35_32735 [Planctomycetaceae bacterium]